VARSDRPLPRVPGAAFLLSQLGGQSARAWAARLDALGLEPREVMLFRQVAQSEGRSQQEIADSIGLPASRIVEIVDRLEEKGWIERRTHGADRRRRELFVTARGRDVIESVRTISIEHERAMTRALDPIELETLIGLLERIAAAEGLGEGIHPGFADARAEPGADSRVGEPDPEG